MDAVAMRVTVQTFEGK